MPGFVVIYEHVSKLELGTGLCAASKRTGSVMAELDSGQHRSQRGAAGAAVGAFREPVTALRWTARRRSWR